LKIYEIGYSFEHEYELPEGVMPEEVDDDERYEYVSANMFIGAPDFDTAWDWATEMLDQVFPPIDDIPQYELNGVKEIQGMDILNWPEEECQCVGCRTERAAEEDKLRFVHHCGEEISVVYDGWETINCPKCHEEIYRDKIVGSNGHYIYININGGSKNKED